MPAGQSNKNLKIFIGNNTNPFGSVIESLSTLTTNTTLQNFNMNFSASVGNYYVSAWVDVDNSGTLTPGDYFGWQDTGTVTPSATNATLSSGSNVSKDIFLSTYGGSGTTATVTINLPGPSTGKTLYLFADTDAHLSNGVTGTSQVTTNGASSYVLSLYNIPNNNYYIYAMLDTTGSGTVDTGNIIAYRAGSNTNTTPNGASGWSFYTMAGNATFTLANNVWMTPSTYSVSGTINLPSAQPTKTCVIKYDLDNTQSNGIYYSTQMPCGNSATVAFTSTNVPTANYYVFVEVVSNINAQASGDYTGYMGTGTNTPPGATTVALSSSNVTGISITPTVIP